MQTGLISFLLLTVHVVRRVLSGFHARRTQNIMVLHSGSRLRKYWIKVEYATSAPLLVFLRSKWRFSSDPIKPTYSVGAFILAETADPGEVGRYYLWEIIKPLPHVGSIPNCHCSTFLNEGSR